MADSPALTEDRFLGGRLTLLQPATGYRAGADPVLLAAAVPAVPGQSVLDLGCGVGTAAFCLQARVGDLRLTGLELQESYADLARRNRDLTGLPMNVVTGDAARMPAALRGENFDHVLTNPPYFQRTGATAPDAGREAARGETLPLAGWIDAAVRRLAPQGLLTVIQDAARLPDLLAACDTRLGNLRVLPLTSRAGRAADRVILRARKSSRGPFRLLPPLILHAGDRHERDGESYRPDVFQVLRHAAPLPVEWH